MRGLEVLGRLYIFVKELLPTNYKPCINFKSSMKGNRISLVTKNGLKLFKESDILYALSEGNYTCLHLIDNQRLISSKKLKEVSSALTAEDFFRIHHSHIINLNHLVEYRNGGRNYVVMTDGKELDISKRKLNDFLNLFNKI